MRPQILDATAGQTAREIRAHPAAPWPILDPTDPRFGEPSRDIPRRAGHAPVVLDPTDSEYGELLD